MSKKRSPIWQYFTVAEDSREATCKACGEHISRSGSNTKTFNTTNLMYHLRTKHCEQFAQYKAAANDKASTSKGKDSTLGSKQLTLEESADKCRKWDISDVRAQAVHRKIGEMIALDDHPFSIVDDGGFVSLLKVLEPRYNIPSRKYFTDTVIPKICNDVKCTVVKEIANASHISLTTDIWSTDLNSCSLLSLTAHWLTPQFERKSAMLHAQPFDGSHTGEAICTSINQMLQLWELSKDRIHLLIRDNAANMVKGITDAGLSHIGCFAHTLQLVIHDAILSQRAVSDMLATSRRIIGHFRRSNLAYTRLKDIQKNLGLPVHRLVQDEPTRWNSTLYMLQRIIEQKMALAAYATEYGIPQLTSHQVTLANKVVKVMTPIEEVTMSISADAAAVSVIIPFVRIISKSLSPNDEDSGIRTMKSEMKSSLTRRFSDI